MAQVFCDSIHALAEAISGERQRAQDDSNHDTIHLSSTTRFLPNRIEHSSVKIECEAGCRWLVETYGEQAYELGQKAFAVQMLLRRSSEHQRPLSEILSTVFPDLIAEIRVASKDEKAVIIDNAKSQRAYAETRNLLEGKLGGSYYRTLMSRKCRIRKNHFTRAFSQAEEDVHHTTS